jgi:hypothetical protein
MRIQKETPRPAPAPPKPQPPAGKPSRPAEPPARPPAPRDNAVASADITRTWTRHKIEAQWRQTQASGDARETNPGLIGPTLAGAAGGRAGVQNNLPPTVRTTTATEWRAVTTSAPVTSTAHDYGFAPRTPESAQAARTVADTFNRQLTERRWRQAAPAVQTLVHQNGSITISASGQPQNTQRLYDRFAPGTTERQALQQNLNQAFQGNELVRPNGRDVEFRFGLTGGNLSGQGFVDQVLRNRGDLNFDMLPGTANQCAEAKGYQWRPAPGETNPGPVVGGDVVWRDSSRPNPAPDPAFSQNNADNRSMQPCERCATNADLITRDAVGSSAGRPVIEPVEVMRTETVPTPRPAMTVRSAVTSGASGAAISGTVSTLQQVFDGKPVDARRVAQDSALGAVTSVGGEAIERSVTNALANRGASTLVSRLGGAGAGGGVISAGMEVWNQRENLMNAETRPEAVGAVVSQAAVGVAAGVAGAQAGAVIGSFIPVPGVGPVVGAAVGFGVGYLASATGADKAIASGVAGAYRGVSDALSNLKFW